MAPTQQLFGAPTAPVAPADSARKLVGRLLDDRFEIVDVLGRGGMGVVFAATDHVLERPVVVKVIAPSAGDSAVSSERLVREARLAGRVQHPAIVSMFHLGVLETGEPYLVMERLLGRDLGDVLHERGRLTLDETIAILEPIADALDELHAHAIVHRDLKPENVFLIGGRTDRPRVKLIDFGLAMLDEDSCTKLTRAGLVLGTPEYIAPECARAGTSTPVADTYSLASIAFELLTGAPPFVGAPIDVLVEKTQQDPPKLSSRTDVRRLHALDPVFAKALARDPAQRPSAGGFLRDLRAARPADPTATVKLRRDPAPTPPARADRLTHLLAYAALATGVLALVTALVS